MSRRLRTILLAGFGLLAASPAFAQGGWDPIVSKWALLAGAGAIAIAAALGALSQSKAVVGACEGLARNPGAAPQIRFSLLLGLVLIESLVIYAFVTALIIFFVLWNG